MKLRKRSKRESIAYFQGYIDSANAAESWLRHHLAADAHDIKALSKHLVGAATAGLSSVDIALLRAPPVAARDAGCEFCAGMGRIANGGGMNCPACGGSGSGGGA